MYGRVVVYTFDQDKDELEARARAAVVPMITSTPGYVSYAVFFQDSRVVSISAWESEEHAKAGDAALLEWVEDNTTMKVESRFTGDFSWLEIASR